MADEPTAVRHSFPGIASLCCRRTGADAPVRTALFFTPETTMPSTPLLSRPELDGRIAEQQAELDELIKQRDALPER